MVTVNNRAPIHSATPESHASTDGAGIEPANRLAAGLRRSRALHSLSATHPVPDTTVKGSSRAWIPLRARGVRLLSARRAA